MSDVVIIDFTHQALVLVLLLSLPPILVASGIGLLVSLIQALTQVQEQTISFAVKLIAVFAVLLLTTRWMGAELYKYAEHLFEIFPTVAS